MKMKRASFSTITRTSAVVLGAALDQASVGMNIRPFATFISERVRSSSMLSK